MRALNYLDQQGDITLEPKRFHKAYRMKQRPDSVETALSDCMERFQQREAADIGRLELVMRLITLDGCRVIALLKYVGETLPGDHCGHCDVCLGPSAQPFSSVERVSLSSEQQVQITALQEEHHAALAHPRQLARFLCGLKSPATTRDKLTKHAAFGCCDQVPFNDILAACRLTHAENKNDFSQSREELREEQEPHTQNKTV